MRSRWILVAAGVAVAAVTVASSPGSVAQDWTSNYPSGVVIDSAGNAYVSGPWPGTDNTSDVHTIKYDSAGQELWNRVHGTGMTNGTSTIPVVSADGSVYVATPTRGTKGDHDFDWATVRYDSAGNQSWVRTYRGTYRGGSDWPTGIAVDSAGNAYVTGDSQATKTRWDYTTVKYDKSGRKKWTKRYNGPVRKGYDSNRPSGIAVDSAGNVYVTGDSQAKTTGTGEAFDFATVKYDKLGRKRWVRRFAPPTGGMNFPTGIAVDSAGNAYVTGSNADTTGTTGWTTIRYDRSATKKLDGRQAWTSTRSDSRPAGIAVDSAGNAYTVCSPSQGTSWYEIQRHDPATGSSVWTRTWSGGTYDRPAGIAIDSAGNAYVTGTSTAGDGINDFATVKYDSSGSQLWVSRYNGEQRVNLEPRGVAVDSAGNVYVTGGDGGQFVTVRYDSAGNQVWVRRYTGP